MAETDTGGTVEQGRKGIEAKGFFQIDRSSKVILAVIAVVSLLFYLPVIIVPNVSLFGLPWLFVVLPVGMITISFVWLLTAYIG